MDKKFIFAVVFISLIFIIVGYIFVGSSTKNKKRNNSLLIPKDNQIVFYYGETCPHCREVEEWMKKNKIEEKIKIEKKEVWSNQANAQELSLVAQKCNLNPNNIGVPFLYSDGKCYIGTPAVKKAIEEKIRDKRNIKR